MTASEPAYWRTTAYTNYTGLGWNRSEVAVENSFPADSTPATGTALEQTIQFARSASALPAAWAPRETNVSERVRVDSQGGLQTTQPIAAGTAVTVVSERVRPSESELRSAGTDDPEDIQRQYTTLPESVPEEVANETATITADADTRYGKAMAVQRYLKTEKSYSLNVSRPAENAAATFLFEMDEGYCQYFATTMVVMLRTQEIPARYVVGYSPGEAVGDNRFVVRGMNAHAWVEVYFPDVGWVRFDPTAASPRLQQERQALDGDSSGNRSSQYPGQNNATEDGERSENATEGDLVGNTSVRSGNENSEDSESGDNDRGGDGQNDESGDGQNDESGDGQDGESGDGQNDEGSDSQDGESGDGSGEGTGEATQEGTIGGGVLSPRSSTSMGGRIDRLSQEIVFNVTASKPAYWRTTAYTNYTGLGWNRNEETVKGAFPADSTPATGTALEQTIQFARSTSALPAAWAPRETNVSERVRVDSQGGLQTTQPIAAGTAVTVVSERIRPSESELRSAGTDDPEDVQERYTALPESVPDEVGELTATITADADTRYGKAMAVQRYLKTEKSYSLNVSRPTENAAATFLFEMDEGYCQYFATTMVVMLRTQGIPARYVVGYSPGEAVGDNRFVVRGMNAHAWVEVYFPDVGWVRFDPTAASPRLQQERQALEAGSSYPEGDASENETEGDLVDNTSARSEDEQDDEDTDANESQSLTLETEPEPVPGKTVTVHVTRNEAPVPGATVLFNDEVVGVTNESGEVRGRVPYTRELRITASAPANASESVSSLDEGAATPIVGGVGPPGQGDARQFYAGRADTSILTAPIQNQTTPENDTKANETYELQTEGTVTVHGEPVPGTTVNVTVTVDDVPVPGANLTLEETFVGRTNDSGSHSVRLPYEENVTIGATRGAVSATRQLDLADIQFEVDEPAIPGDEHVAVVTVGNRSLSDARVDVGNRTVGRTNASGQVAFAVPYEENVTLAAHRGGLAAVTRLAIDTNATLSVRGALVPGTELDVAVRVDDVPVPRANVTVAGKPAGETNTNGTASVRLPYEENVTLRATRSAVSAARQFDLASELHLDIEGPAVAGDTARLTVTAGNRSVGDSRIEVGNRTVGRTDATGHVEFPVPYRDNATITATKGNLSEQTQLDINGSLTVEVTGWDVPFATQTVRVTVEGSPVPNATVSFGGETVGQTDEAGRLQARLPLANSVAIRAQRGTLSTTHTLSGLFVPLLGVVGVGAVIGAGLLARRRGDSIRSAGSGLRSWIWSALVVGIPGFIDRVAGVLESTARQLRQFLLTGYREAGSLYRFVLRLRNAPGVLRDRAASVLYRARTLGRGWLRNLRTLDLASLLAFLRGIVTGTGSDASTVSNSNGRGDDVAFTTTDGEDDRSPFDIERAWQWLVRDVDVSRPRQRTPGYIASRAIAQGYEREAVEHLLAAYRDVTYSDRTLSEAQLRRAEEAFRRLQTDDRPPVDRPETASGSAMTTSKADGGE